MLFFFLHAPCGCAFVALILATLVRTSTAAQCLSDDTLEGIFATDNPTCCQNDVCNIPCPEPISAPTPGFGIAIGVAIALSFCIGIGATFYVQGEAENFFVAGRTLPLWIVTLTLGAQCIDSNAILGNADLAYKYSFYDGAVLPIGLGLSLLINGIFLARHINNERALTLPDILGRRYGKLVEVFVSVATIVSFMILLAGQLVGMGTIFSYLWGMEESKSIWLAAVIIWAYTASGGLFSVAYTDIFQGIIGWLGCVIFTSYLISTTDSTAMAPPPSIGFPGYIYPDAAGEEGICDLYQGVPCNYDPSSCCYNESLWCPSDDDCRTDNGAYPIGDASYFSDQMTNFLSLSPFPNAMFFNWATILILSFGNLAALDFQARCLAAQSPKVATWGCFFGGILAFIVGIPFALTGSIARVHYGPDSVHAAFDADSCSTLLGLPTCAAWVPDSTPLLHLLTHNVPGFLGGWCLFGIVSASMSTADGAILAMGTVFSHNVLRHFVDLLPHGAFAITNDNLLTFARLGTIPFTVAAAAIAAYYKSAHPAGATAYLLIVAFDVVFATVVVPLFGCFYAKTPRPTAALASILVGGTLRIVLEATLPKDGFLLLPYDAPEYLNFGTAATDKLPTFFDTPSADVNVEDVIWQPDQEICEQKTFEDFTGADSLGSALAALIVFVLIQYLENKLDRPLFKFPGMEPYEKGKYSSSEELAISQETVAAGVDESPSKEHIEEQPEASMNDENDGDEVTCDA